jgi:hypothetical protein
MIDGYFALGQTYPHKYISTPAKYFMRNVTFNIDAVHLAEELSKNIAFETVTVSRSTYKRGSDTRWYGLYTWTVSFIDRLGDVPPTLTKHNLHVPDEASNPVVTIDIADAGLAIPAASSFYVDSVESINGNEIQGTISVNIPSIGTAASIDLANGNAGPAIDPTSFKNQL